MPLMKVRCLEAQIQWNYKVIIKRVFLSLISIVIYSGLLSSYFYPLKVIYKGFFKSFIVLYADTICPEYHFVENRIENFPSV